MQPQVILLDVNWQFHQQISLKRAVRLICRGAVEVIKNTDKEIHKGFFMPAVLRLLKVIRKFYGKAVMWSKSNLFVRDNHTCAYCGHKFPQNKLTVDHIVPQCDGGKTTWENTVASCHKCNNIKDNKRLHEVGYTLKTKPIQPTVMEFAQKKIKSLGIENILKELGVY